MNDNQLTELPPELSQLTNLKRLGLGCNPLTGSISADLSGLTNLERLYLDSNQTTEPVPGVSHKIWPVFCDDNDSGHEGAIEQIARWGITLGCGNSRFCPGDAITRSQMAAFLHRAVTYRSEKEPDPALEEHFKDVDEDAWYRPYAQWAVAAGVMKAPDGRFNPGGVVTRADMAEMLTAAFDHITPPAEAQGIFTDMEGQPDRVVRAAEALRAGVPWPIADSVIHIPVTQGCAQHPLRYCPNQPVTRAQMASFFHRALVRHIKL